MSTHIDHCTAYVTTPQHTGVSVGTHEPVFYYRDLNDLCDLVHAWQGGDVRCHVVTEAFYPNETRPSALLSDVDPDCILATGKVTGRKIDGRLLLGSPKIYTRKTDPEQTVAGYLFTAGERLLFFVACDPWQTDGRPLRILFEGPTYAEVTLH